MWVYDPPPHTDKKKDAEDSICFLHLFLHLLLLFFFIMNHLSTKNNHIRSNGRYDFTNLNTTQIPLSISIEDKYLYSVKDMPIIGFPDKPLDFIGGYRRNQPNLRTLGFTVEEKIYQMMKLYDTSLIQTIRDGYLDNYGIDFLIYSPRYQAWVAVQSKSSYKGVEYFANFAKKRRTMMPLIIRNSVNRYRLFLSVDKLMSTLGVTLMPKYAEYLGKIEQWRQLKHINPRYMNAEGQDCLSFYSHIGILEDINGEKRFISLAS